MFGINSGTPRLFAVVGHFIVGWNPSRCWNRYHRQIHKCIIHRFIPKGIFSVRILIPFHLSYLKQWSFRKLIALFQQHEIGPTGGLIFIRSHCTHNDRVVSGQGLCYDIIHTYRAGPSLWLFTIFTKRIIMVNLPFQTNVSCAFQIAG